MVEVLLVNISYRFTYDNTVVYVADGKYMVEVLLVNKSYRFTYDNTVV